MDLVLYWTNKMIGESILELQETNVTDESNKSKEYDEYQPITGRQLNCSGQIGMTIENQFQFLHLHNSYLPIEGDVLKDDNPRYTDANIVALPNNGLFSSMKFIFAGTCQLSWTRYITSRFGELFINIL